MKVVYWLLISLINWFIITNIIDIILMGFLHIRYYKKNNTNVFLDKENKIDVQEGVECSGYSCAFVLRNFGIEANGVEVYQKMSNKMRSGYVYPKGITELFQKYNINCKYYKGNMNSLRYEISKGNPVIVLIKYNNYKKWLHYVPVVGIDQENVYFAESLRELVNDNNSNCYNRYISIEEFKRLWNTSMLKMPCYKYTYFSINK